jgi:hypothetical protein
MGGDAPTAVILLFAQFHLRIYRTRRFGGIFLQQGSIKLWSSSCAIAQRRSQRHVVDSASGPNPRRGGASVGGSPSIMEARTNSASQTVAPLLTVAQNALLSWVKERVCQGGARRAGKRRIWRSHLNPICAQSSRHSWQNRLKVFQRNEHANVSNERSLGKMRANRDFLIRTCILTRGVTLLALGEAELPRLTLLAFGHYRADAAARQHSKGSHPGQGALSQGQRWRTPAKA